MKRIYKVSTSYGTLAKLFLNRSNAARYYKELKRDFSGSAEIDFFLISENKIDCFTIQDR